MKTFTRIFVVIAIGAVITAGLSACISISSAPPPSEEELALRDLMENASWNVQRLTNPPSLDGFVKISKTGYSDSEWAIRVEAGVISSLQGEGESARGRTIKMTDSSGERTLKLLGLDADVWYALTAPELPGVTYYFHKGPPSAVTVQEIYKRG